LGFELPSSVLSYITKSNFANSANFTLEEIVFSQRQKEIISYVRGYVVGTLYKRVQRIEVVCGK